MYSTLHQRASCSLLYVVNPCIHHLYYQFYQYTYFLILNIFINFILQGSSKSFKINRFSFTMCLIQFCIILLQGSIVTFAIFIYPYFIWFTSRCIKAFLKSIILYCIPARIYCNICYLYLPTFYLVKARRIKTFLKSIINCSTFFLFKKKRKHIY